MKKRKTHLVGKHLGTSLLGLLAVDELHQHALVLELVTLGLHVEVMVQVLVDLAGLAVLAEQVPVNEELQGMCRTC